MSEVKCETPPAPGRCCCNCKWLKPARMDYVRVEVTIPSRFVCWAPELDYADVRTYEHSLCEMWQERAEEEQ